MKSPYISRVEIKNFRNYKNVDVALSHKQVIIGENNVGKTNFLRAIQLILDPNFSDIDRRLELTDFHDELQDPMKSGDEIIISIEIANFEHNSQLISQFSNAVIENNGYKLKFTYKYFAVKNLEGKIIDYRYIIFQGTNEGIPFTSDDRSYVNIRVIGALRDVVRELNSNKKSPLYKLIKEYNIPEENLEEIAESMSDVSDTMLEIEEIKDVNSILNQKFRLLSGVQKSEDINIRPYEIDIEKLLYTMQIYVGIKERSVSELSLGLSNILYLSLMLLLLEDKTISRVLIKEKYNELLVKDKDGLLKKYYKISTSKDKYLLRTEFSDLQDLYSFLNKHIFSKRSTTFLAIEEPESHLHPVLQRLIYREVLQKSDTSVLFTTHSTYITSVAPLDSIVRIAYRKKSSHIKSTATMILPDDEKKDLERYLDAKRGEIYFGKGVILVEGITEEFIVPQFAILNNTPLDTLGIVICNIHSTNFSPYLNLLVQLEIPWVLITDGDYYEKEEIDKGGEKTVIKNYHRAFNKDANYGFAGLDNIFSILISLKMIKKEDVPTEFRAKYGFLRKIGCHVGISTFEVDCMNFTIDANLDIIKKIYSDLKTGGAAQQQNFDNNIDKKEFWSALKKIENNIGKGRFAQRLASEINVDMIPKYLSNAVNGISKNIREEYE